MRNENKKFLAIIIPNLFVFLSILFFFAFFLFFGYFPLTIILFPFTLTPLLIGAYKYNSKFLKNIFLCVILICIFIFALIKIKKPQLAVNITSYSIIFLIMAILPVLLFIWGKRKNLSLQTMFSLYIYYTVFIIVLIIGLLQTEYFSQKVSGLFSQIDSQFNIYIEELKKHNISDDIIQQQLERKVLTIDIIKNYFPGILFNMFFFYFTLNIVVSYVLISRYYVKKPVFLNIFSIKVNEYVIWLFIASWSLLFVFLNLHIEKIIKILWNTSIIISTLYFLQGISVTIFRMLLFNIHPVIKFIFLLIIFYLFMQFIIPVSIIIMGIGVLDLWLDFRKLHTGN